MLGKPRPALILQHDRFEATESVTVRPFTTTAVDAPLIRVRVDPTGADGLDAVRFAMVDEVTTVRRGSAGLALGALEPDLLLGIERGLLLLLGLAG